MNRYYDNMEITSFDAQVISCEYKQEAYHITLTETAFYPEKGGMAKDTGTINGIPVIDVYEHENQIFHVVSEPIAVGSMIHGEIDYLHRLHKCQVHTAQHILSYYIESKYPLITSSHHVSGNMADIAFTWFDSSDKLEVQEMSHVADYGDLTASIDASAINDYANNLIRKQVPINICYPTYDEYSSYQKKTNFQPGDEVRVVKLGDEDYNFCGCIHVPNTAYIQMVHVSEIIQTKTGIVIHYQAGEPLRSDHKQRMDVMKTSSVALKFNEYELHVGIKNLLHQKQQLEQELYESKQRYLDIIIDSVLAKQEDTLVLEFEHLSTKEGQTLASRLTAQNKIVYLLLKMEERCHVIFASPKESNCDMKLDYAAFTNQFGDFKGGGNASMAQGGGLYRQEYLAVIKAIAQERKQQYE